MNLLVISQYFYPEQFRVSDVCFKLAAMGHHITLLTGLPNYPAGEIFEGYDWDRLKNNNGNELNSEDSVSIGNYNAQLDAFIEVINGVKVVRCKLSPRKNGKKNLALNYISFAYNASKVAKKLAENQDFKFDKILVFQYSPVTMAIPGVVLKRKLPIPLILYCFDLWPESIVSAGLPNSGPIYNLILSLSKWIYNKADKILISSKNFEKYFNNKLNIHNDISYLPIYAEDLFLDHSINKEDTSNKQESQRTNLVFAGNIGEMQSIDTIIKAANLIKEHEDIHFHIVGDGSALDKSIQLAKDLDLNNITFHGRHPLEEMPKYYDMADAFLVTLKKDEFISYTLPGKVQSYMATGKPIIAAIDGETSDVIKASHCGLCCAAEDHQALAQIVVQFTEEKENRQKYGDCSKSYYENNFSEIAFMQSLLQHIT